MLYDPAAGIKDAAEPTSGRNEAIALSSGDFRFCLEMRTVELNA